MNQSEFQYFLNNITDNLDKNFTENQIKLKIKYLKNYSSVIFGKINILEINDISELLNLYNKGILKVKPDNIITVKFQPVFNYYFLFLQAKKIHSLFSEYNSDSSNFKKMDDEEYILINNIEYPIKAICSKLIPFSRFFKDFYQDKLINKKIIEKFKKLVINYIGLTYFNNKLYNNIKSTKLKENNTITYPDEIKNYNDLFEGTKKQITVNAYERSSKARQKCIENYGINCTICGFDFEKTYGDIGHNFIHVHHIKSLSEIDEKYKINPITDLRPVCPNCHAMLHQRKPAYSIEEIQDRIEQITYNKT